MPCGDILRTEKRVCTLFGKGNFAFGIIKKQFLIMGLFLMGSTVYAMPTPETLFAIISTKHLDGTFRFRVQIENRSKTTVIRQKVLIQNGLRGKIYIGYEDAGMKFVCDGENCWFRQGVRIQKLKKISEIQALMNQVNINLVPKFDPSKWALVTELSDFNKSVYFLAEKESQENVKGRQYLVIDEKKKRVIEKGILGKNFKKIRTTTFDNFAPLGKTSNGEFPTQAKTRYLAGDLEGVQMEICYLEWEFDVELSDSVFIP